MVTGGWKKGGMESYFLMDVQFQFGMMKKFQRCMVVMVTQRECI